MGGLEFRVLGGLEVRGPEGPIDLGGRKQRAVLAALVVAVPHAVSVDRLVDVVWGDDPPARPEASLQAYVSNLRRLLGADVVARRPAGYALDVERGQVDALRFEDAVAAAGDDLDALDDALAAWGPPLPEFSGEPFTVELERRCRAAHGRLLDSRFDVLLAGGRHAEAIPALEAAVVAEPLHEHRWAQLAVARYRAGRQADALRALQEARRTLAEEAGLEPGPHLRALEADVLAQAVHLSGPVPPVAPPTAPTAAPPAGRGGAPDRPFVGRAAELHVLVEAAAGAFAGAGCPVVISGEPGIGKTRLAAELMARHPEAVVAVAACPESGGSETFAPVAALLERLGATGEPARAFPRALAATTTSTVLVLDDAQWADAATLRLLEAVAAELRRVPVVLVLTVRASEVDRTPALVDCLAELARQPGAVRVALGGLSQAAVGDWLHAELGAPGDATLAAAVHGRSSGNAFFVQELISLLRSGGEPARDGAAIPQAVQDVVGRRIGRLPGPTQQLLSTASIVGDEFEADVLARVAGQPVVEVLDHLDAAVATGLVQDDRTGPGRYRFAHALVRESLAEEVSPARQARAHAAIFAALEALRPGASPARLAHHALHGALAGTADAAVVHCVAAARRARDARAPEDAMRHWTDALRALELARPGDLAARHEFLVELGRSRREAANEAGAVEAFLEAIEVGDALGDPDAVTAAARLLDEPNAWQPGDYGTVNTAGVAALERAVDRVGTADSAARAQLLSALAGFVYYRDSRRCEEISAEALAVAERVGDPLTLLSALKTRFQAMWRVVPGAVRLALAERMVAVADGPAVTPEWRFVARFAHWSAAYQLGADPNPGLSRLRELAAACPSIMPVIQVSLSEAAVFGAAGRHREAEDRLAEVEDLYRRTRRWGADPVIIGTIAVSRTDQGRGGELLALRHAMASDGYAEQFRVLLGWVATEIGADDDLEDVLPAAGPLPAVPEDWLWLAVTIGSALVVAARGRPEAAALYEQLRPFAGEMGLTGTAPLMPSVDHALGRLAAALGDDAAAWEHLQAAVRLEAAVHAEVWRARSLAALADLGERSLDPARRTAAAAARREARELADRLPIVPLQSRLHQV